MQFLRLLTAALVAGSTLVAASPELNLGAAPAGLANRALRRSHRGMSRKVRRHHHHGSGSSGSGSDSGSWSGSGSGSGSDSGSGSGSWSGSGSGSGSSGSGSWSGSESGSSSSGSGSWSSSGSASSSSPTSSSSDSSSNAGSARTSGSSSGSSSSGGGGYNGQKNGLAWPDGPYVNIQSYKKTMGWLYSWDAYPATGVPSAADFVPDSIDFFPMLWGNSGERVSNWQKYVLNDRNAPQNKAKVAMGPNEVNQQGQSELSVSEACTLMRQNLMPLKNDGWSLIGASTNGAPDGITWMNNFKSQCNDVWSKIDYDSLHLYSTDPQKAINYFEQWYNTFKKPVFITETACMNYDGSAAPNLGQAYNYVKTVNSWAQSTSWVKGLAFYGAMKDLNINAVNRLTTSSGSPTDLFTFWINNSS